MNLPHSSESEHELCAAVFVDHRVLEDVADLVTSDDFFNSRLRFIWFAMTRVVERDGSFDLPLFREYLRHQNLWDQSGGDNTISNLMDRSGTTRNVAMYAREVRKFARLRAVIAAGNGIGMDGLEPGINVEEFCAAAELRLREALSGRSVHRFVTPAESVAAVTKQATEWPETATEACLPSGFSTLDNDFTPGGLPRKLIVIASRPKMGKTNIATQLSLTLAKAGHAGVFFSMEMTASEVTARMMANEGGVDSMKIMGRRPLTDETELGNFAAAGDVICKLPLLIDEQPRITAQQIRSRVGRAEREIGQKLDFCVVDYFNIMSHPEAKGRRTDEAMAISSGILTDLAKERGMCVILLAQLSRKPEERSDRRPIMSDLRECGALEQDAALILSPFWPHWYWKTQRVTTYRDADINAAELMVMANRFGGMGSIPLRFSPEFHRYTESTRDPLYG